MKLDRDGTAIAVFSVGIVLAGGNAVGSESPPRSARGPGILTVMAPGPAKARPALKTLVAIARRLHLPLLSIPLASGAFVAAYTSRVTDWIVMTDELLYAKLALSIAENLSALPMVRGEPISLSSQLYPLLTAPIYAAYDMPTAFQLVHVVNAAIMVSAAIPAYLLARSVLAWQPGAYLAAAFSVAIPWLVLSFYAVTEVAAYPAFLWAVLAIQQSVTVPGLRQDLFAVGAIGLAISARTQFFVLALVLPAAVLLHEVGYRLAVGSPNRRAAVRDGVRATYDGHRVLAIVCGVAAFVAIPLVLFGNPVVLLGPYAITATEGSLVPAGIWQSATAHLAAVAIATGALPFILAAQWALMSLVRPASKRSHAFGVLLLLVVIVLTFQVASFAVRFGDGLVRDRYLFYVAPLFFIGMLASLRDAQGRWVGVLYGVALFALLAQWADLTPTDPWESSAFDRPASVLNGLLTDRGTDLRLGARGLVAVIGLALGLIVAFARAKVPRAPLSYAVAAAVLFFCALETRHTFERLERGHSPSGRLLAGSSANDLDWIDEALPAGERASLVPYPLAQTWGPSAIAWWDAEFWNKTVRTAFDVAGTSFSYTPESFPRRTLSLDFESGRIEANDEPAYLVLAANDVSLRPRGRAIARREQLVLLRAERPYTAEWATRGLTRDGWTRRNRPATLRLFAGRRAMSSIHRVTITLSAMGAVEFRTFGLRSGSAETSGRLVPGAATSGELDVCVPAHGFVDVLIEASPAGLVPGLPIAHGAELTRRPAGLQLLGISTVQRGRCSARR